MSDELKRMQELAGVPVNEEKESLNENQIGGIVGIGAIHTPKREKSDYEMAFEHFMTEGEEKEEKVKESVEETINEEDIEEGGFGKMSSDGTEGFGDMLYKGMDEAVGIDASAEAIRGEVRRLINKFDFDEDLGAAVRSKFA